jgi:hypothetical protein
LKGTLTKEAREAIEHLITLPGSKGNKDLLESILSNEPAGDYAERKSIKTSAVYTAKARWYSVLSVIVKAPIWENRKSQGE